MYISLIVVTCPMQVVPMLEVHAIVTECAPSPTTTEWALALLWHMKLVTGKEFWMSKILFRFDGS